ncbi:MAG: hypothetical protein ACKPKO_38765, partial [Candidatus Fonsibacter sp.]
MISNNGDIHSEGNGPFTGTLSAVGNITSTVGNITSYIGNISAYGNVESYNGNITAPWGNISGQSISSTSTITATGNISGGTMTTHAFTSSSSVLNIK